MRVSPSIPLPWTMPSPTVQTRWKSMFVTIAFKPGAEYRELADKYYKVWGDVLRQVGILKD